MKPLFCLFFVSIFSLTQVSGQEDVSNIEHNIDSAIFGKERKVRVFLPQRYFRDSTTKYMVTYVLDAQSDEFWDMAKNNLAYLSNGYSIIPTIVVGVVSDNRGEEFDPPAHPLQDHLKQEVFPLIQSNYRTDDFRVIVGHSWGGAFVCTTLFSNRRDMFDAYIGISPSFGDVDNMIVPAADSLLQDDIDFQKYLYLSYGNVGSREFEFGGYVNTIDSLMKKYPNKSLAWQPRMIDRTDHWQVVIPSFNDGMLSMARNYFPDQKVIEDFVKKGEDIEKSMNQFLSEKEKTFGYSHEPSSGYLNFIANDFRDLNDYDSAISLYKIGLRKEPNNVRCAFNLADSYYKKGDKENAIASMLSTQKLLEENKDSLSEAFYKNAKEYVVEKLNELK